jgi:hypothetical protein
MPRLGGKLTRAIRTVCLLLGFLAPTAPAQVFPSEFFSDPVSEDWNLVNQYCAVSWVDNGRYLQRFDPATCPTGNRGAQDAYWRSIAEFNGGPNFFLEFLVQTNGNRSEIPRGAPVAVALGNNAGIGYNVTVASDLVKFFRDVDLPIWFIEIEPGMAHTYRIEISPSWFSFYIDAYLIDEGSPDGPFPAYESEIVWLGRSWDFPAENAWDYIRYGVTPVDGSGDFDSNAAATLTDFYFVQECLTNERPGINGGPDNDAGPGCRFADFDADSDVDLLDFAAFQRTISP